MLQRDHVHETMMRLAHAGRVQVRWATVQIVYRRDRQAALIGGPKSPKPIRLAKPARPRAGALAASGSWSL
jgi:hypothetical protein